MNSFTQAGSPPAIPLSAGFGSIPGRLASKAKGPGFVAEAGATQRATRISMPNAYLSATPRKMLEVPPAAARAFVKDMCAFHAAATGFERDEIMARQLHALREHLRPGEKLRSTDVYELFLAMKDHA